MSNSAQYQTALTSLLDAIGNIVTALKQNADSNTTAENALRLSGQTLEEIRAAITGGTLATLLDIENSVAQHAGTTGNVHNMTKADIGLALVENMGTALASTIQGMNLTQLAVKNDQLSTPATTVVIARKAVQEVVGTAPEALNTLAEFAEAFGNNPDVINEILTKQANKLDIPTFNDAMAALNKDSVGLDKIVNAAFATQAEAENHTQTNVYMDPAKSHMVAESKAITLMQSMADKFNAMANDINN